MAAAGGGVPAAAYDVATVWSGPLRDPVFGLVPLRGEVSALFHMGRKPRSARGANEAIFGQFADLENKYENQLLRSILEDDQVIVRVKNYSDPAFSMTRIRAAPMGSA